MFGLVDFETSLVKKYCNPYIYLVYLPNRWDSICFYFLRLHLIFHGLHGILSLTVVYLWEKTLFCCIKFKKWNDTWLENWVGHLSHMCFLTEHGVSSIRQRAWGLVCMWCSHWPGQYRRTKQTVKAESEEDQLGMININCSNILLLTIISIKINWESVDSQKWLRPVLNTCCFPQGHQW